MSFLKPLNQKAVEKSLMIMGKIGEEITNIVVDAVRKVNEK